MATTQAQKDAVQRGIDALNDRDREAFAEIHAADLVIHDRDDAVRGIEAVIEHEWAKFDAFPDMAYDLEDLVAEGNLVAGRWTASGTHEGEFDGIQPTGETVEFPVSGVFRVEDGLVAEGWLLYDAVGLMQQLGVVEPPAQ